MSKDLHSPVSLKMDTIFLKLGGSLITDKTEAESVRRDVLTRLAAEIAEARRKNGSLRLLLGHGSGSFGHVAAAKHGTRQGVATPAGWRGFAEVGDAAARLNRLLMTALLAAGLPAVSLPPSASAVCKNGRIQQIGVENVAAALDAGLLPVVYGDVAFDSVRGGTIVSTEEVMMAMVGRLRPSWLLLAGETAGVYDRQQQVIPTISQTNYAEVATVLGGSRGTDVTGGMASKVQGMLSLLEQFPHLSIRIFSGLESNNVRQTLLNPAQAGGTLLQTAPIVNPKS
ncbi:Isopentenyl phosphate kinase [hydrothermal vent metagenome]|uniref:Isopentenyl phosphate kinase n=1 Tax=hydrothermal vent metagenome TaxID=652676 RepID=A0A3B0VP81_9ZZZZ